MAAGRPTADTQGRVGPFAQPPGLLPGGHSKLFELNLEASQELSRKLTGHAHKACSPGAMPEQSTPIPPSLRHSIRGHRLPGHRDPPGSEPSVKETHTGSHLCC